MSKVSPFLVIMFLATSQESPTPTPEPSPLEPCQWSQVYQDWLKQWQASPERAKETAGTIRESKKIRTARIEWPEDSLGRKSRGGIPVVEAVIDRKGRVAGARLIRRLEWEPAWPEFDQAILTAIQKWEFEPVMLGRTPAWVCMTTSINITWR